MANTLPFGGWTYLAYDEGLEDYVPVPGHPVTVDGVVAAPTHSWALLTVDPLITSALTNNYSMAAAFDLNGAEGAGIDLYMDDADQIDTPIARNFYSSTSGLSILVSYGNDNPEEETAGVLEVPWSPVGNRVYLALTVIDRGVTAYAYDDDEGFVWNFTLTGPPLPLVMLNKPIITLSAGAAVYGSYWTEVAAVEGQLLAVIAEWGYAGGPAGDGAAPS